MKIKRLAALGAVVAAGALVLAGCSSGGGSEITSGTSVTVAQNSAFSSLNANTVTGNSTYNQNIIYMTSSGFNYYDNSPKLVKNTKFGTYTVVSKSPLTIKYTINDGVKWSDGTQVGASDMLLNWASSISKYNDPKGVNFTSVYSGTSYDLISKVPKISDDNRSITIVYDKPYVDWEVQQMINVPASAVYELSGLGKETGTDAQNAVIKIVQSGDETKLKALAKAWSTGFNYTGMPKNKAALVTDGPYAITNLVKNQYVTLTANKDYNWGPLPHAAKITVRFIPDQTAQVQALANGEINILYGQATSDTVKALAQTKGVTTTTTPTSDYEHVDLTLNNGGPFDPKTYGGDAAKALEVRQAFLKSIPRDTIIERLVKPLASNITPDDSQTFIPGQDGYADSVKNNGHESVTTLDIAGAKDLLAKAGVTTPVTVNFAYANDNPRREGEFQLIQASAAQAGFNVVDVGKPTADFFGASGLGSGQYNYDATVFAWSYTSLARTGGEPQVITGGNSNFNGYSNASVDANYKKLEVSTSDADAISLLQAIDKQLWADAESITLFQLPDVSAHSSTIQNVSDAPLVPNVFWNFWEWTVKK